MAALVVGIAVMGVLAATALPVISQSVQRDKEAELVFRGEQYARAIGLFQRKMGPGTLPPNIDVLVDQKFLRRKFKDPITGKDFRPLTAAEAQNAGANRPGGSGGRDQSGGERAGAFQGAPGSAGLGGIPTGMAGGGLGGAPLGSGMGQGSGPPGGGLQGGGAQGGLQGGGPPQGIGGASGRGGAGQAGQAMGGVVGVISTSPKTAIRLYNGRDKYNEWAFVYNPPTQAAGGAAGAGANGGAAGGVGAGGPAGGRGPAGSRVGSPGQNPAPMTNPSITGPRR